MRPRPGPDSLARLRMRDVTVGYRTRAARVDVLRGLNLQVRAGELVCLLGPNGAGKSTLLRTMAGMQPAMAGTVELGGLDLRAMRPLEVARRLGVVLTERPAVGSLSARRVVELGRYPHSGWFGRLSGHDLRAVKGALEAVGALGLAERELKQLSDGERQRVMIARALAQDPLLLLLDEPTAFLDLPARVELMGLLQRLAREQGLAIVLSSHDLELALRTADTVWLAMPGGLLRSGAPEDLVLAGDVAAAFASAGIRFLAEERAFRLVTRSCGRAAVVGSGLGAALAGAVAEREGYAIVRGAGHEDVCLTLLVDPEGALWRASVRDQHAEGTTFADLADFIRNGVRDVGTDLPAV